MPPTEDSNCPDGMESNPKVWVIILFVLLCLELSFTPSFNRKSVYRNSTSPIEVKGTCLRCDLIFYGRLMVSLITKVTVNQKLLTFLSQRIVVTLEPDVHQTHTHQNFVAIYLICQKALVYTCERIVNSHLN